MENEVEAEHFVQFAAAVDDGEAICLALAKCRNWTVAQRTTERQFGLANAQGITTITTAEIVRLWADGCNARDDTVAEVLRRIERYARFSPRKGSPLQEWWKRLSPPSAHWAEQSALIVQWWSKDRVIRELRARYSVPGAPVAGPTRTCVCEARQALLRQLAPSIGRRQSAYRNNRALANAAEQFSQLASGLGGCRSGTRKRSSGQ